MASKRVILRLRESQFPEIKYSEIIACVESFLVFTARPAEEAHQDKHFWHLQLPSGDSPIADERFHIVIDVNKSGHSGPLPTNFPHEIYRVKKVGKEM